MAVGVTRAYSGEQIEDVLMILAAGRENPMLIKRTDFVLEHFGEYVHARGTAFHTP
jgi:hypothetical protein